MSQQLFVDREEELRFLTERYRTPGPECLVLYGRRRVGKTALLARFLEDAGGIYFLASEEGDEGNIREFSHYAAQYLDDPHFGDVKYPDWQAVFSALVRHRSFPPDSGGKPVLVIDEFPYLISRNRAIPSIFQKIWDTVLSRESLMLVLCGSSVAAMETEVLGYKSPLYGRRTGQWQVEPLQYPYLSEFLPYEGEDLAMSWFILGGVPAYLKIFSPDRTLWENVAEQILRKGAYLYSEPELLLQYEFREAGNYMAILRAMAGGRTTLGSLCQETGLDRGMVSKYLSVLTRLRIVTDEVPVTAHSGYRRRHYRLSDPYLSFWFRFVYPGRAEIETGHGQAVAESIREQFPLYCGEMFEVLCRELVRAGILFPGESFSRIGRWWQGEEEIDLVGLDESTGRALFVECKWTSLTPTKARGIMSDLQRKSRSVRWREDDRNERFCVIARHIDGKEELGDAGSCFLDLEDISRQSEMWRQNR